MKMVNLDQLPADDMGEEGGSDLPARAREERRARRHGLAWIEAKESERAQGGAVRRPIALIVVRESDEWNLQYFDDMRLQTYLYLDKVPAVAAVRRAGLAPFDGDFYIDWEVDGETVRREVQVARLRVGDTKAYLFYFEGYWHLWSRASAAKMAVTGRNNFTDLLIEQIERLCPVTVHAANLSRLIRSEQEAARLIVALRDRVDLVDAQTQKFELTGEQSFVGFMMLTVLGWCASRERMSIIQRLSAGRVAQWRRGEWPLGSRTVPFGYTYNRRKKRLEVDESKRDAVRAMLEILCTDAPASQKVRELDRIGVRGFRRSGKNSTYKALSGRSNPDGIIQTFMLWASVWVNGEYLHRFSNPLPTLSEFSGHKVVRHLRRSEPKDAGELQMLSRIGVPEGGWAEPELLEAFALKAIALVAELLECGTIAEARPLSAETEQASKNPDLLRRTLPAGTVTAAKRRNRDAARSKNSIAPLLGRNWIRGDWFYELLWAAGGYTIVRWPLSTLDENVDRELRRHRAKGNR